MSFKNLNVSAKLRILVGLAALMLFFMASMALFDLRQSVEQERQMQLRSLLDTSISLVASLQAKAVAGEISDSEAKQQARALLASLHYADNEYFFVLNANADVLVHGGIQLRLAEI